MENLIGQKFNKLLVIDKYPKGKSENYWLCRCDCGNEVIAYTYQLKNNKKKSCGCIRFGKKAHNFKDITEQKFGKLTVIKRVEDYITLGGQKRVQWLCRCDCNGENNEIVVAGSHLRSGHTKSCGCERSRVYLENFSIDLIGKKYNRLLVIDKVERNNQGSIQWLCLCDCGNTTILKTNLIVHGITKSCGCFNSDSLKRRKGSAHPNWNGMGDIKIYLRNQINQWKLHSVSNANYKCIITNDKFDDIHHLYPFSKIVDETVKLLELPIYEEINKYTDEDLKLLTDKCLELHYKYGLGVCLTNDLHKEFHNKYGKLNFTPEDFYEFYKDKTGRDFDPSFLMINFNTEQINNIKEAI